MKASRVTAKEAMAQAGITKDDVSLWNFYVAYPLAHPMHRECSKLRLRDRVENISCDGRMSFGGDIPWSTIGDAPGRGHTGSGVSAATYVETARQLMGKAGERR